MVFFKYLFTDKVIEYDKIKIIIIIEYKRLYNSGIKSFFKTGYETQIIHYKTFYKSL